DGLAVEWKGSSELRIEGAVRPGRPVSLKVNYDPGWKAWQDGRRIEIGPDERGFLLLHASPSEGARIDLHFAASLEQRWMGGLSVLCWIGSLVLASLSARSTTASPGAGRGPGGPPYSAD